MAYETKYHLSFYDRFQSLWKIELLFKDYTGVDNLFIGAAEPLEFMCEDSNGDPFSPIKTKSVVVRIVARTFQQYIDLQNASLYQVQCKISKDSNLYFHGWVRPDEYSEEVQNEAHIISITAVCGLTLLKDIEFDPTQVIVPYSAKYRGFLTSMDVVRICLLNTQITGLPLLDGVEFYAKNGTTVVPDESFTALKQDYVHRGSLRETTEYKDCYTVLSELIRSKGCRIMQEYVSGQGLCWLLESIRTLDVPHYVRVISLTTFLEESSKIEINNFITVTNAQGSPMTVITDLSGVAEIQNTPGKLILVSDPDYDENLVKDSFDYTVTRLDQVTELNKEDSQLIITPLPVGQNYTGFQGIEFPLGYFELSEDLVLSFAHSGGGLFQACLVVYASNGNTYVYDSEEDEFRPTSLTGGWCSFYTHVGTGAVWGPVLHYDEISYTKTIPSDYFPPSNTPLQGRFVLIIRSRATNVANTSNDYTYFSLTALSFTARATFKGEPVDIIKIYSNSSVKKSVDFVYSDVVKYPRPINTQTPWADYNVDGLVPNFSFGNTFFVHDTNRALFVEKWKLEGFDTEYGLMELLLVIYDKIYSQNRLKLSADILGQIDLSNILVFQDVVMLIDRWSLRVKSGIQTVSLLEIGKYEEWLVTESDVIVLTESDSDYIEIEQ